MEGEAAIHVVHVEVSEQTTSPRSEQMPPARHGRSEEDENGSAVREAEDGGGSIYVGSNGCY